MKQSFRSKLWGLYLLCFTLFFLVKPGGAEVLTGSPLSPEKDTYQPRYQRPGSSYQPYSRQGRGQFPGQRQRSATSSRQRWGEEMDQEESDETNLESGEEGELTEEWIVFQKLKAVAGDTYVDLSWKLALEGAKVREVEGYLVRYGLFSGQNPQRLDVGTLQAKRIRNLSNKITYFFEVLAYDQYGNLSRPSEKVEATPLPEGELMSGIERMISGNISEVVSVELKQFGYDLFTGKVSTFAPVEDVPVGPDYIIGPGDAFSVSLWGKVEATYPVEVDRDGKVLLPEAGAIDVWGLSFSDLKKVLHARISKFTPEFQMHITMQRLRTIQVFVVGNAVSPGSYSLSSLSTMINALFACGGPTKNGALRGIQLLRSGKVVNTLDLYNFLLKGDKSQDARLQPGDTIFIPFIGKVVGVAGNVKRPAIYEIEEETNLKELLAMAGGVMPVGYLQRVQVERIMSHEKKIVVDLNLSAQGEQSAEQWEMPLQDGDLVKIEPILPGTKNIVELEGHVLRPGGYEWKEGMKISDLIASFNDLQPEVHLEYAEIIRLEEPDYHERVIPFNLGEMLKRKSEQDLKLQNLDRIKVFSKTDFQDKYNVTIIGQVRRPESYKLFEGMRVRDLVNRAGGFLDNAYLQNAELTRLVIDEGKTVASSRVNIDIEKAMAGDVKENIALQKYDTLKIQIIPEWETAGLATITGEVQFPGDYPLKKGEKLSSLIKRAGGYSTYVYLRGAVFTRESAKLTHRKRINELISKMEIDIQSTTAMIAGTALDKEDIAAAQQALASQGELLRKLRSAEITGRVVINLRSMEELAESKFDIELEDGDKLVIPDKPGIVEVLGEVYNPTALFYEENQTVSYYLDKVGGPTKNAEDGEIYLVKADGSVISRSQEGMLGISWDVENNRWTTGGFMATKVWRGDVVLVPRKLTKIPWLKTTTDLVQIIFQTAVATGVLVAIF